MERDGTLLSRPLPSYSQLQPQSELGGSKEHSRARAVRASPANSLEPGEVHFPTYALHASGPKAPSIRIVGIPTQGMNSRSVHHPAKKTPDHHLHAGNIKKNSGNSVNERTESNCQQYATQRTVATQPSLEGTNHHHHD